MNTTYHMPHTHDSLDTTVFGFWLYIMSDCVLFASLFATFAVLHNNTFGGPSAHELFSMPFVLLETIILLTSSFTCGLAMLAHQREDSRQVLFWLAATLVLGAVFIALELYEFSHLFLENNSWTRSGFLSSYFTLVGTHGLHVTLGLVWILLLIAQISIHGISNTSFRRLMCFSLFWHFLDIVWIFIFSMVYLLTQI